jgi:nitrous oxide reductase accessory protein NosL
LFLTTLLKAPTKAKASQAAHPAPTSLHRASKREYSGMPMLNYPDNHSLR